VNLTLIAAMSEDGGIGVQGQLPWHLPADLAHFKANTVGKTVIMGRKTYESIGKPLPNRRNIVMSRQPLQIEGVEVIHELEDLKSFGNEEMMIIGGEQLYRLTLPWANQLILTTVHTLCQVDCWFPSIDFKKFECIEDVSYPADEKNAFAMTFKTYRRL
jgi:dihydrofolate reductase